MPQGFRWPSRLLGLTPVSAVVAVALLALIAVPAHARNGSIPSEVFAVFTKSGSELIVNLGDHDDFTQLQVPAASFPASFSGTLSGAGLTVVGDFDENLAVNLGGPPIPRPNVMFGTASADAQTLTDAQLSGLFDKLTLGSTGFIDTARSIPVGGSAVRLVGDPSSLQSKVGSGGNAGGLLPFQISVLVTATGGGLLLPVFGGAASVLPGSGGPPREIGVVLPLRITTAGLIKKLVLPSEGKPVPSRVYGVFTKGGNEVVVNLGDHDDLATRPVQIDGPGMALLGGTVEGASFAVVGVFDKNHVVQGQGQSIRRSNLLYTTPAGTTDVTDPSITAAFNRLVVTPGNTGFIDTIPTNLAIGGSVVLSAANSFATKFGSTAGGAFSFSVQTTIPTGGISIAITGAAIAVLPTLPTGRPHEVLHIQQLDVTPGGEITAVHTI